MISAKVPDDTQFQVAQAKAPSAVVLRQANPPIGNFIVLHVDRLAAIYIGQRNMAQVSGTISCC